MSRLADRRAPGPGARLFARLGVTDPYAPIASATGARARILDRLADGRTSGRRTARLRLGAPGIRPLEGVLERLIWLWLGAPARRREDPAEVIEPEDEAMPVLGPLPPVVAALRRAPPTRPSPRRRMPTSRARHAPAVVEPTPPDLEPPELAWVETPDDLEVTTAAGAAARPAALVAAMERLARPVRRPPVPDRAATPAVRRSEDRDPEVFLEPRPPAAAPGSAPAPQVLAQPPTAPDGPGAEVAAPRMPAVRRALARAMPRSPLRTVDTPRVRRRSTATAPGSAPSEGRGAAAVALPLLERLSAREHAASPPRGSDGPSAAGDRVATPSPPGPTAPRGPRPATVTPLLARNERRGLDQHERSDRSDRPARSRAPGWGRRPDARPGPGGRLRASDQTRPSGATRPSRVGDEPTDATDVTDRLRADLRAVHLVEPAPSAPDRARSDRTEPARPRGRRRAVPDDRWILLDVPDAPDRARASRGAAARRLHRAVAAPAPGSSRRAPGPPRPMRPGRTLRARTLAAPDAPARPSPAAASLPDAAPPPGRSPDLGLLRGADPAPTVSAPPSAATGPHAPPRPDAPPTTDAPRRPTPPDDRATSELLSVLLQREQALRAVAAELPRAGEQAARRMLEVARRLAARTGTPAPATTETLASGSPSAPGAAQVRWSNTHRQARELAAELTQLLRTSQTRRRESPSIRRSEEPVPERPDEVSPDGERRDLDVERALAAIVRDVAAEIRHRDLTWLSEDPHG